MGAGASAGDARLFCHGCGARTACVAGVAPRCRNCGATEGVEVTDARLPLTLPSQSRGGSFPSTAGRLPLLSAVLSLEVQAATPRPVRVESVTVVAIQRPIESGLLLQVLPNIVVRRDVSQGAARRSDNDAGTLQGRAEGHQGEDESEDWDVPLEPACNAFVSRLEAQPMQLSGGGMCVICTEDLSEAMTSVVVLSCEHTFHEACIRRWLARRHTCPSCRLELEVDDVKYLRSIGLSDEADVLEKVELERQAKLQQKQAAERRRWVESMRRGEPVHFGLTCGRCLVSPLVGDCFKCATCDSYMLCTDCHDAKQDDWHPSSHPFVLFGALSGGVPHGPAGLLTVLVPASHRRAPNGSLTDWEPHGEASSAAAEVAFAAVRSLALAPLSMAMTSSSPRSAGRVTRGTTHGRSLSRGRGLAQRAA